MASTVIVPVIVSCNLLILWKIMMKFENIIVIITIVIIILNMVIVPIISI